METRSNSPRDERSDQSLASAGFDDGTVRIWNPAIGREVHRLVGHVGGVYTVAFAPDGKSLVSGGQDATTRIWDVASGKERQRATCTHAEGWGVWSVTFSRDGKKMLATDGDTILILKPATP